MDHQKIIYTLKQIQVTTNIKTMETKQGFKSVYLSNKEIEILHRILFFLKDKEDWKSDGISNIMTAKVWCWHDEEVATIINTTFKKLEKQ